MTLKNNIIGLVIVILTVSVAVTGINIFHEGPEYEDFCGESRTAEVIETQERCEEIGGEWNSEIAPRALDGAKGFCDRDFTCRNNLEDAREKYSRTLFLITLPLGIAIIALGAIFFGLEAVGAGLMAGGVGIVLWGVGSFWRFADDVLKFILSLIGLVIVIWVAYYFNKKFEKKGKKGKKK